MKLCLLHIISSLILLHSYSETLQQSSDDGGWRIIMDYQDFKPRYQYINVFIVRYNRNVEKDIKVFLWCDLNDILDKLCKKFL